MSLQSQQKTKNLIAEKITNYIVPILPSTLKRKNINLKKFKVFLENEGVFLTIDIAASLMPFLGITLFSVDEDKANLFKRSAKILPKETIGKINKTLSYFSTKALGDVYFLNKLFFNEVREKQFFGKEHISYVFSYILQILFNDQENKTFLLTISLPEVEVEEVGVF